MPKKTQDEKLVETTNFAPKETVKEDVQNHDISDAVENTETRIDPTLDAHLLRKEPDWDLYYEGKLAKNAQMNSRSLSMPAIDTEAEKVGVDALANFTIWALDVSAYIKESLKDGKFSFGEKAMVVVKIFGGINNLGPDNAKKIARELADLTSDEKKYIASVVTQKFPIPNFDKALEIASDVIVIIEKAINIIEVSSQF